MSAIKTTVTDANVDEFINTVEDEQKRADSFLLLEMFKRVTGEQPKMWGSSIVGFGQYHYKSERSTQEGDWMLTGFSPRKQNLTLYILNGFEDLPHMLQSLGKHKTSKSCLYINRLEDVDLKVLEGIIRQSYATAKEMRSQSAQ